MVRSDVDKRGSPHLVGSAVLCSLIAGQPSRSGRPGEERISALWLLARDPLLDQSPKVMRSCTALIFSCTAWRRRVAAHAVLRTLLGYDATRIVGMRVSSTALPHRCCLLTLS